MSDIKIFNTLTRQKEIFKPINDNQVGIYVCGVTVYDYCHIGHGRMFVNFDVIRRWFIHRGYCVNFVQNITDVDDKIISRALAHEELINTLTNRFICALMEDVDRLNVLRPDHQPRASQYIPEMCNLIGKLIQKKYAYQSNDGDINYSVRQFKNYGKLSGKCIEQLQSGENVIHREGKRDPLDFVLWKKAKPSEPKDAIWNSPWGEGRPGWHIECSAMSHSLLGDQFDIHGGGQDLQFPHHENEIAQSEGVTGLKFVNYWMHNGHIKINDEKMSKSTGNFVILRHLLEKYDGEVVRLYLMSAHYRSPLEFNEKSIEISKASLTRLYLAIKTGSMSSTDKNPSQSKLMNENLVITYCQRFHDAMNDDFNTPQALSVLFAMANDIFRNPNALLVEHLIKLANILGLLYRRFEVFLQGDNLDINEIEKMINKRHEAKLIKDFETADLIRATLLKKGIILEDASNKTSWRKI